MGRPSKNLWRAQEGRNSLDFSIVPAARTSGAGRFCGGKSRFQSKNRRERTRQGACIPVRQLVKTFLASCTWHRHGQTVEKPLENSRGSKPSRLFNRTSARTSGAERFLRRKIPFPAQKLERGDAAGSLQPRSPALRHFLTSCRAEKEKCAFSSAAFDSMLFASLCRTLLSPAFCEESVLFIISRLRQNEKSALPFCIFSVHVDHS